MSSSENAARDPQEERRKLWEEFCNDQVTISIMKITPDELARLHNVFLMSGFTEKHEILGALKLVRRGWR